MFVPMVHAQNRSSQFLPNQIDIENPGDLFWVFLEDYSYYRYFNQSGLEINGSEQFFYKTHDYDEYRSDRAYLTGSKSIVYNSIINNIDCWYWRKNPDSYPWENLGQGDEDPLPLRQIGNYFFGYISINPSLYTNGKVGFIYSILLDNYNPRDDGFKYASCWIDSTHIYFGESQIDYGYNISGVCTDVDLSKTVRDSYQHNLPVNQFSNFLISGSNLEVRLNGVQICSYQITKNSKIQSGSQRPGKFYSAGDDFYFTERCEHFNTGLDGFIYETLFYPRILSSEEVDKVEGYLNDKWNIY